MGRPKKAMIVLDSLAACNLALADLRETNTDIQILDGDRARAVAAASSEYEDELDEAKRVRDGLVAALEAYYYGHVSEIEKDGAKFVQLANGRIGRRDTPAALRPLNRKWSWDAIGNAVRAWAGDKWRDYFRVAEPEIDKEALKAAQLAVETLKQLGLKLEPGEKFYADPAELPAAAEAR